LRIEIEKSSLPKQAKALLALQNSLGSTKIEQVKDNSFNSKIPASFWIVSATNCGFGGNIIDGILDSIISTLV
jgi:hypothetical protein